MRHLIGLGLAVAMVVVLFFAGAWGYLRLLRLPVRPVPVSGLPAGGGSLLSNSSVLVSLAAVIGTGLLAGILIGVPRISPIAAGLPGLLLIGWTALYLADVQRAVDLIPLKYHAFGAGFEAMLFNGTLGAAGVAMAIPLFVPSRWRTRVDATESEADEAEASEFVSSLGKADEPTVIGGPGQAAPAPTARVPFPAARAASPARAPSPAAQAPSEPVPPWPTQSGPPSSWPAGSGPRPPGSR